MIDDMRFGELVIGNEILNRYPPEAFKWEDGAGGEINIERFIEDYADDAFSLFKHSDGADLHFRRSVERSVERQTGLAMAVCQIRCKRRN